MGIRGFYFVWHGEWADSEIVWHGYAMNIHEIEDPMWSEFCEMCKESDIEQTDENFISFCRKEVWRMREYAQNVISCGGARKIKRGVFKHTIDPFASGGIEVRTYPA